MQNSHCISVTELRGKLYQLIDQTIETGVPIEIERRGHILKVSLEKSPLKKIDALIKRPETIVDPTDNLIDTHWLQSWDSNI